MMKISTKNNNKMQQVPSFQAFLNDKKSKMSSSYPFLSQEQIFLKVRKMWKEMDMVSREKFHKFILQNKKTKLKSSVEKLGKPKPKLRRPFGDTVKGKWRSTANKDTSSFHDDDDTVEDISCDCDSPYLKNKLAIDQLNLQSFVLNDDKRQIRKDEQRGTDIVSLYVPKSAINEELGNSILWEESRSRPADQPSAQKTYSGRVFEFEHHIPELHLEYHDGAHSPGFLKTQNVRKTRQRASVSYSDLCSVICDAAENIVECDHPHDRHRVALEQSTIRSLHNQDVNPNFLESSKNEGKDDQASGVDDNATEAEDVEIEGNISEDSFFTETENSKGNNGIFMNDNLDLESSQRHQEVIRHSQREQNVKRGQFPLSSYTSSPTSDVGDMPLTLPLRSGKHLRSMSWNNPETSSLAWNREQINSVRHNQDENKNTSVAPVSERNTSHLRLRKSISRSPRTFNGRRQRKQSHVIKTQEVNETIGSIANLDGYVVKDKAYSDRFNEENEKNAGLLFRNDYRGTSVDEDNNFVSIKESGISVDADQTRAAFIKASQNTFLSTPYHARLATCSVDNSNYQRFSDKSKGISIHNNVDGNDAESCKHEAIPEKKSKYARKDIQAYRCGQNPLILEVSYLENSSQNVKPLAANYGQAAEDCFHPASTEKSMASVIQKMYSDGQCSNDFTPEDKGNLATRTERSIVAESKVFNKDTYGLETGYTTQSQRNQSGISSPTTEVRDQFPGEQSHHQSANVTRTISESQRQRCEESKQTTWTRTDQEILTTTERPVNQLNLDKTTKHSNDYANSKAKEKQCFQKIEMSDRRAVGETSVVHSVDVETTRRGTFLLEMDPQQYKTSSKYEPATLSKAKRITKTQPANNKRKTPRRGQGLSVSGQEKRQEITATTASRAHTRDAVQQASLPSYQAASSLGTLSNSTSNTPQTQKAIPVTGSQFKTHQMKDSTKIKGTSKEQRCGKKLQKIKQNQLKHQLCAPRTLSLRSSPHQKVVNAKSVNHRQETALGYGSDCLQMTRDQPLTTASECRTKKSRDKSDMHEILLATSPGRKTTYAGQSSRAATLRNTPKLRKTLGFNDEERPTPVSSPRELEASPGSPTEIEKPLMGAMFQDVGAHSSKSHEVKTCSRRLKSGSAENSSRTFQTLFYEEDIFM